MTSVFSGYTVRHSKYICGVTLFCLAALGVFAGVVFGGSPTANASARAHVTSLDCVPDAKPDQKSDELDDLTRQFNQLYSAGRFREAAGLGERALRAAEKSYGAEHVKVAEVL